MPPAIGEFHKWRRLVLAHEAQWTHDPILRDAANRLRRAQDIDLERESHAFYRLVIERTNLNACTQRNRT